MSNLAAKKNTLQRCNTLTVHPLAETVPGMRDEEFDALCSSVKAHGQRIPIVLFEGKILDGRHRYRACLRAGIEPKTVVFEGKDAEAFVLDAYLHRRHLTSMQKALVGARMHLREQGPLTQRDACALVGVSPTTLNVAIRLLKSGNTPLISRSEAGGTTQAEVEDKLFDREAARQAERVQLVELPDDEQEDDDTPGAVTTMPTKGKKRTHPERRAKETPASAVVQAFKGLTVPDKAAFVDMARDWLNPVLEAKGWRAPNQNGKKKAKEARHE